MESVAHHEMEAFGRAIDLRITRLRRRSRLIRRIRIPFARCTSWANMFVRAKFPNREIRYHYRRQGMNPNPVPRDQYMS